MLNTQQKYAHKKDGEIIKRVIIYLYFIEETNFPEVDPSCRSNAVMLFTDQLRF